MPASALYILDLKGKVNKRVVELLRIHPFRFLLHSRIINITLGKLRRKVSSVSLSGYELLENAFYSGKG